MEFLYPNMLFALFALVLPVVIHLFNFRRHKVVYFSNTSILKTIEQENHKTKRIKDILVLMLRMLFVAALVMAFAMPYRPDENVACNNSAEDLVAIYVDNSMSMQSYSSERTLFDEAKMSSLKLIDNLDPTRKFILVTNDRDPKNEYPMNKDEMMMCLDEMRVESAPVTFDEIYNNVSLIRKKNGFSTATLFAYSDYQKSMMKLDEIRSDTSVHVVLLPLKSDFQNNVYVDTVWLSSPVLQKGFVNELNVRVVNNTDQDVKGFPVDFSVDGSTMAVSSVDVKAMSHSDVVMQFVVEDVGDAMAKVSIKDAPISFDDDYYFVLKVRHKIDVVEIKPDDVSTPMKLLFSDDPMVAYKSMNPYNIDRQSIMNSQMIVLHENAVVNTSMQQYLLDFAEEGGCLVIFNSENTEAGYIYDKLGIVPDGNLDDNVYKVGEVLTRSVFFDDVFVKFPDNADLPEVSLHMPFTMNKSSETLAVITLQNGDPLLMISSVGKGYVFVCSTSLDERYSDLANHAIFVPIMYKMALWGGKVSDMCYTIGVDKAIGIELPLMSVDDEVAVKSDDAMHEAFPVVESRDGKTYMYFFETVPSAGFYDVTVNDEYVERLAWNDDRKESVMDFCDEEELAAVLKDKGLSLAAVLDCDDIHSDNMMEMIVMDSLLWKIFVIVALISLLIEILILRFWK